MPSSSSFLRRTTTLLLEFLVVLLLNSAGHPSVNNCSDLEPYLNPNNASSHHVNNIKPALDMLNLDGHFDFNNTYLAASDFGNRVHFLPAAILYPTSVSDISRTIKYVFQMGPASELTVAARGHGHSLRGQSQAENGIVINMQSLAQKMHVHTAAAGKLPYVDVSGGDLWINVLRETLRYGLSPKSWTDYLHLTIGGTLSNAGVSGQAFRHGPQIENVYQLEVVTGRGDVVICSEKQNADLFYGVLGGLGQFGIITRARIALEPAPQMVKWIRVLYSDFDSFTKDQELLISSGDSFNYVEGFVIINRTGLLNSWRLSFNPKDPVQAKQFRSEGRTLYCLEVAKYFNLGDDGPANNKAEDLLSRLNYLKHTLFQTVVSYIEFLDRVHLSEIKLREKGLWDVPHPWLNVLVPQRSIRRFAKEVFGNILTDSSNGPILLYPVNQSTWNNRTSMVTPVEEVFYLVAILPSSMPTLTGSDELEHILAQNRRILQLCEDAKLGVKQYLAFHKTQERWRAHFGPKWAAFARRKSIYDPLAILAPGQGIFKKQGSSGQQSSL